MILGVTGGMGVGKSALSRYLVALEPFWMPTRWRMICWRLDPTTRASLRKSFGADIEDQNGQLDRRLWDAERQQK